MAKNIVKAAGMLLIINVCVKLLGFVREMVMANAFGASSLSDAYQVAYTIPYFLQSILGYAFVSAVLPVLSNCWREGRDEEAQLVGNTLINAAAGVMLILTLIGMAAAPLLVWLTAPKLSPEVASLATEMTRIIFPSLVFMAVGMVISGILNSRYRFAAAAIAPGVASAGVIIATLLSQGSIYVAALGTLLGYVGFFLVTGTDLPRIRFRYRLRCDLRHPLARRALLEMVPIVLGFSVNQIYVIINRVFASGLIEGSISALNYASKLMNLPLGLFVAAVITAIFPSLAALAREGDQDHLASLVSRGLSMILLIVIPAAAGMMLLASPIVSLLFQGGSFDAADTYITAHALVAMSPGLIFLAASMLLMRVYYALDRVIPPLVSGAISIGVNIILSLALVGPLGHAGLAWANSAAAAANALLMLLWLQRDVIFCTPYLGRTLRDVAIATALMSILTWLINSLLPVASGKLGLLLTVGGTVTVAVTGYFLALRRTPALGDILSELRRKN